MQRLAQFRAIPIDGDRLQPDLPCFQVDGLDVLDTAVVRQVDRLRDTAGDKRLCCGHHADMRFRRQDPFYLAAAVCAVEYSVMQIGRESCRERVCQSVYISVVAVSLKTNIIYIRTYTCNQTQISELIQ